MLVCGFFDPKWEEIANGTVFSVLGLTHGASDPYYLLPSMERRRRASNKLP